MADDSLSEQLVVRVTKAQYAKVKALSKRVGLGRWVRARLFGKEQ